MARDNVELFRSGLAAVQHAYDTRNLESFSDWAEEHCAPDFVLRAGTVATFAEGEWRGPPGLPGFVANQMDVLDNMWIREDELIEVDDERLLVSVTFGGRARHSGIDVELSPVHVYVFRDDGMCESLVIYQRKEEAIDALGLGTA